MKTKGERETVVPMGNECRMKGRVKEGRGGQKQQVSDKAVEGGPQARQTGKEGEKGARGMERETAGESSAGDLEGEKDDSWDSAMRWALAVLYPCDDDVNDDEVLTAQAQAPAQAPHAAVRRGGELGEGEQSKGVATVKIEDYDGAYHCVICCQSVCSDATVLHCSQCSSNSFHKLCVEKIEFIHRCLQCFCTVVLSYHGPAARVDSRIQGHKQMRTKDAVCREVKNKAAW